MRVRLAPVIGALPAAGCAGKMNTTDPKLEVAIERGRWAAALIDQERWDEAAVELDLAKESLSKHASALPIAWVEYLGMAGLVALHRGEVSTGCEHLQSGLDLALRLGEALEQADVLDAASLLFCVKIEWKREELVDLATRLRAYWKLDDAAVARSALPVIEQLARGVGFLGDVEPKLLHDLASDAIRGLESIAGRGNPSMPRSDCLDWLLDARLDPESQKRLATVLTTLRSAIGPRTLDGRRLAAHLIGLACRRGDAARAASLIDEQVAEPLDVNSELQSPFESVALTALKLLHDKGRRARARALRPRVANWLAVALGDEGDEDADLRLRARLASAAGERSIARDLFRRRVAIVEQFHGSGSSEMLEALSDLFCELQDQPDVDSDGIEVGNTGLELARESHGNSSEEAAWWRGMLVFHLLRNDQLDDAAALAEEGARLLETMSGKAAQRTIDASTFLADALERRDLSRRAAELRRYVGKAS